MQLNILPSFAPTVTELREKLNHMITGIKINFNTEKLYYVDEGITLDGLFNS